MSSNLLYECTSLFIHLLIDIWCVSSFWLLWIKLLWIFCTNLFFEICVSISLEKMLKRTLLGAIFSFKRNWQTLPLKWLDCFTFPPTMYDGSSCSTCLPTFNVVSLFNFSHSGGCRVDLIIVSIYISLMTNNIFWCAYCPFIYLPLWSVCSSFLSIKFLDFHFIIGS